VHSVEQNVDLSEHSRKIWVKIDSHCQLQKSTASWVQKVRAAKSCNIPTDSCKVLTDDIIGSPNFNFASKFLQKWSILDPNFVFLYKKFRTRKFSNGIKFTVMRQLLLYYYTTGRNITSGCFYAFADYRIKMIVAASRGVLTMARLSCCL